MAHRTGRRVGIAATALFASTALLAGCASSADGNGDSNGSDTSSGSMIATKSQVVGEQGNAGEPSNGGQLSFAGYSMPKSLDPTVTQPSGSTGGTEMASVYGLLMRYDANKDEFVPQLAKSLEESDDHLTYTLTLPDDVAFSDGTPMDAQSVIESIDRYNDNHGANTGQFLEGVESMEATDPATVVFHLNHPWSEFPALLTFGHGMIVAPAGYADPDDFTPIGAGPYTVSEFTPGSSLTVEANDDWWNGTPYLDSIDFVDIQGGQPKVEALNSGGIQMAYLRDADQVKKATAQYPGYVEPISATDVLDINMRDGHPGSDLTVRKAIAHAINPDTLNQRAHKGLGSSGKLIFQDWSKWHSDVDPIPTDPEKAKQLLQQAESDGFDGTIDYLSLNNPVSKNIALAIQSMLDNAGFNVNIDYAPTAADLVKKMYVDHDYDLTYGAYSISDAVPYMRLSAALRSDSSNNIVGIDSDKMDGLLDTAQQATSDDAERDALADIQKEVNETIPFVPMGAGTNFVPWSDNVHGAVPSTDGIMLLGKAWMS